MKTWTKHEVDRNDQYDILYITNDSGEYEMTLTSYNNGWGYPCLTYYCPEKDYYWDNDRWIFGRFYNFLKRAMIGNIKKSDSKTYSPFIATPENCAEMLEILDYTILTWTDNGYKIH